jgi:hypothetical protein
VRQPEVLLAAQHLAKEEEESQVTLEEVLQKSSQASLERPLYEVETRESLQELMFKEELEPESD